MKIGVFIGRMQPMHNGHFSVIKCIAEECDALVIGVGSANKARSTKNPFLYSERKGMIDTALDETYLAKDHRAEKGKVISNRFTDDSAIAVPYEIIPIPDFTYNDQMWLETTANMIEEAADKLMDTYDFGQFERCEIKLYGHDQGSDTRYLHQFPQWGDPVLMGKSHDFHATDIRRELFFSDYFSEEWKNRVPETVSKWIQHFFLVREGGKIVYQNLLQEAALVTKIKEDKSKYRYAIIDHTVDAVVICNGHVLMVTRGVNPGKGQLALPGGYLNEFENFADGIVRELIEETRIALKPSLLRNLIQEERIKCYSAPGRSVRGRIITHCGLINYQSNRLPEVKGSDDAAKAEWIPLNHLDSLATNIFEDHYCIIRNMLGHC